jgi:hypothetical protein
LGKTNASVSINQGSGMGLQRQLVTGGYMLDWIQIGFMLLAITIFSVLLYLLFVLLVIMFSPFKAAQLLGVFYEELIKRMEEK